jgi:hypothetical protein
VGVGDSLEASLALAGPIAAGTWHLVGDGIVLKSADVQFDVLWRHGTDTPIVSWTQHFDPPPPPVQFYAVKYDADAAGAAVPAEKGDQLVLRWSIAGPDAGATTAISFIPNGDGANSKGRIPSLILPR